MDKRCNGEKNCKLQFITELVTVYFSVHRVIFVTHFYTILHVL